MLKKRTKSEALFMAELIITTEIMLPVLLMLALGWLLRRMKLMSGDLPGRLNKLIFQLFLPVMLFDNVRSLTAETTPDLAFPLFIVLGLFAIWLAAMLLVPRLEKDVRKRGVMVQGVFRSNFAILGVPLMDAMFGESGLAAVSLAMPAVVVVNNVLAVISLTSQSGQKADLKKIILSAVTNPLIIACALGGLFLLIDIPLPAACDKIISQLSGVTTPLSLLVLGASLNWQGVKSNRSELIATVVCKQFVVPFVMLTLAVLCGFRNEALGVLLICFGAPCAVSSYPMAQAMGGDAELAAGQVVLTTVFSMATMFIFIYLGKLLQVL